LIRSEQRAVDPHPVVGHREGLGPGFESGRDVWHVKLTLGDVHHQSNDRSVLHRHLVAVDLVKDGGRCPRCPLICVDERVVTRQSVQKRCSLLVEGGIRIFTKCLVRSADALLETRRGYRSGAGGFFQRAYKEGRFSDATLPRRAADDSPALLAAVCDFRSRQDIWWSAEGADAVVVLVVAVAADGVVNVLAGIRNAICPVVFCAAAHDLELRRLDRGGVCHAGESDPRQPDGRSNQSRADGDAEVVGNQVVLLPVGRLSACGADR